MSIISFIKRVTVQTCVYWGNPVDNGFGGKTFDAPVELKCRWESKVMLSEDKTYTKSGELVIPKSEVLLNQEVDENGYLYLGTLDELYDSADSSGETLVPAEIQGAYVIKRIEKIPLFRSTTKFVYTAYTYGSI